MNTRLSLLAPLALVVALAACDKPKKAAEEPGARP